MPRYSLRTLQHFALAISVLSIFYNGAEGAVSIVLGAESDSRSLIFFGIQSGIEVASAIIVVWRFRKVAKPGEEATAVVSPKELRFEKIGSWSIGILLVLLALATLASAITGLVQRVQPDSSNAALIISASALVIMILIWLPKVYLARELNSSTMQGEATCSLSCIQITIVLFVGALVYRVWKGGWWVDSATSLVLGILFAREGYKMIQWVRDPTFDGGCCKTCKAPALVSGEDGFVDTELGESYRDLCECCEEKEACRNAGSCVCGHDDSSKSSSGDVICCKPVGDVGEKCCSHETRAGPRPFSSSKVKPHTSSESSCIKRCCSTVQSEVADTRNVASKGNCKDACCTSPPKATPEIGEKDCSGKSCCAKLSAVSADPHPLLPSSPPEQPAGCAKGCCTSSKPNADPVYHPRQSSVPKTQLPVEAKGTDDCCSGLEENVSKTGIVEVAKCADVEDKNGGCRGAVCKDGCCD